LTEKESKFDLNIESFKEYQKASWNVHVYESCTSTFDIAKQLIKDDAEHGTLIIADVQTGGKGRQARKWHSPSGGIWMGIILKPKLEVSKISSITLLCAVAVAKAIDELHPRILPSIKWPNDIYINDKKLCGILTETVLMDGRAEYVIAGIGVNANNATENFDNEIKQMSISFKDMGIYVNRAHMASKANDNLLELIKKYESSGDLEFILDYYIEHMQWLKREAVMKNTITGKIANRGIIKGIDTSGRLLLETDKGIERIVSGELSLRSI